ncbi:TonB-dependent receptor [Thalassotalea eurytherma]|uniref:TonB-dependent receptor n=1 Tax=Thalassotalea eurytherma TaxID=1144278 RepID=A0ABQ6GXE9_9GAMM|nr:TonB-dependent receptor [Thalassotalea eurytherma]GLX80610.1 hypothetical protein theurythT_00620 [Thalassotalea eurytherma]
MTKHLKTFSLLVSSALIYASVFCNLAFSKESNKAEDIEKIVVTNSRYATELGAISRSINIYDATLIEQVQVDHIQQVLNQQAGVFINRNSGQEMLLAIRSPVLTGAGACGSFLTMENGVPLRPTGFCNVNELFESHYELAERIEVIKGPSSVFYGSGGLHGGINIINTAAQSRSPFIKGTVGQWGYQQLSFLANNDLNALSASISHDGGYRDESGFEQQKISFSNLTEYQGVDIQSTITATNLNQETAGYIVGKNSYKDRELSKSNPNPEAYRDAKAFRISQRYDFNNGLMITPFARYSDMEFLQHFVPGKPVEKNQHYSFGVQNQYHWIYSSNLSVDVGLDIEFANISLLEEQDKPTEGSAFLMATIPEGKHYDYQVDALTVAGFVGANYALNDKFSVTGGVRLERIDYDYTNKMNAGRVDEDGNECGFGGCRFSRPENSDDNFTIASPKIGLVYQEQNSAGFINVSHGFRAPQTTELYRLQREQQVSDLAPEEMVGIDASWSQTHDQMTYSIQAYWYEKSNVILRDNDYFYVSDGETEHKGLELSLSSLITNNVRVDANLAYARHIYANNPNLSVENIVGNDISNAPNLIGNAAAIYQTEGLELSINAQYIDDYYLNPENTSTYEGHTVFHLRSKIEASPNLSLFINIDNLFDKKYAERANYSSFTGERYFPGLPRNIKASVKYEF